MNKWEGLGNLARDPDFEYKQSGSPEWRVTIAVNEPWYNSQTRQQEVNTLWVRLVTWGSLAEELWEAGYGQGDEVYVVGSLIQHTVGEGDSKDTKTRVKVLFLSPTRRRGERKKSPDSPAPKAAVKDPWEVPPQTEEPPF